ncbi:MAG: 23S rRNA (adenine(2503)-C(2))-methyltransferase RlmN, partial [Candidatus Dadabacteria bacterium]
MDGSDLKPLFFDLTKDSLALLLASRFKAPSYCASQIYDWVYRKGVRNPASMTNVKKALREELGSLLSFQPINYKNYLKSRDGTFKFLFEFEDGECVESVLINQDGRYTICVSSQAGCALGCRFCCTAKIGLRRNLSTSEIISQILSVSSFASRLGIEASSIVFMGMGEPLHNFKRVVSALKILTDPDGLGFSERKITLSTSGLVPAISDLYKTGLRVNLAVSLNATTDKVRTELMPINRRYPISLLLDTLK